MLENEKSLGEELNRLLSLKTTKEEREELSLLGITGKDSTKLTVVAAALYQKAVGGDLSAIKELIGRLGSGETEQESGVVIIDDMGKEDK